MVGEDAVVQGEPGCVVDAGTEGADADPGGPSAGGARPHVAVQVQETARGREAELRGDARACGRVVVGPEVDAPARRARCASIMALGEQPRPMPRRRCAGCTTNSQDDAALVVRAVGDGVGVAGELPVLEGEHGASQVVAAAQAEELVLAQRLVAVGERGGPEQLRKLFEVVRLKLRRRFRRGAYQGLPAGVSANGAAGSVCIEHCNCNWLQLGRCIAQKGWTALKAMPAETTIAAIGALPPRPSQLGRYGQTATPGRTITPATRANRGASAGH